LPASAARSCRDRIDGDGAGRDLIADAAAEGVAEPASQLRRGGSIGIVAIPAVALHRLRHLVNPAAPSQASARSVPRRVACQRPDKTDYYLGGAPPSVMGAVGAHGEIRIARK
jgi:hypothetical protein